VSRVLRLSRKRLDAVSSSVELKVLLEHASSAYRADGQRVQLDGVLIAVPPRKALGLRMVVRELATNAVKYGAPSNKEGYVRLSWQIEQTSDGE
jgi:two-component sensor histidine kinase